MSANSIRTIGCIFSKYRDVRFRIRRSARKRAVDEKTWNKKQLAHHRRETQLKHFSMRSEPRGKKIRFHEKPMCTIITYVPNVRNILYKIRCSAGLYGYSLRKQKSYSYATIYIILRWRKKNIVI